ncbi:hypothetical protein RD792_006329 [Penstemon davidsonii]|uniref:Protein kinase domain-containing protein n=1 Tax=Penstemon davidsonii TaxID=160366 RepID=A0ABR0DCP1_9LAMI|nr:hypothetical protein RD792_006329 [Penstemon davidsonii]
MLSLPRNRIYGEIPSSLTRCHMLEILSMSINELNGNIPGEIWNLSSLQWVDLARNSFTGTIPPSFGNLSNLMVLELSENKIQVEIPCEIGFLSSLTNLRLGMNNLNGEMPQSVFNLSRLEELALDVNEVSGQLPSFFINRGLPNLEILYLGSNQFSGRIPNSISNLSNLNELDHSSNSFSGHIPITLGNLHNLEILILEINQFTNDMSVIEQDFLTSLANCRYLKDLSIANNSITGLLPKSISSGNLSTSLESFVASSCRISGIIPNEIGNLSNLIWFALGDNELNGIIPETLGKLENLQRKSLLSPPSNSPLGLAHERVSYYELLRATNNLDEVNLIGKGSLGSVYKGIFSNGMTAAVKVFDLDVQGSIKSFDIECQILRSIRHRNLVKVITSCSNLDFKALVLEYMRNGNLDQWLYSPNYFLSIAQRLGIMIDVASAIKYLHQDYSSPIVHCDLKPSNILLDENMVALVGDFGIAKLLTNDRRMELTKTLGTIGYMAPEYGSEGLVSTSVDVYSYGILLMETFTRKKPTDEMFLGQLTLRNWVFGSLPNGIAKLVDDDLLNVDRESIRAKHEMLLTQIIELALECTIDSPEERLNMKDVLIRLKKIKIGVQEQQNRGRLNV